MSAMAVFRGAGVGGGKFSVAPAASQRTDVASPKVALLSRRSVEQSVVELLQAARRV